MIDDTLSGNVVNSFTLNLKENVTKGISRVGEVFKGFTGNVGKYTDNISDSTSKAFNTITENFGKIKTSAQKTLKDHKVSVQTTSANILRGSMGMLFDEVITYATATISSRLLKKMKHQWKNVAEETQQGLEGVRGTFLMQDEYVFGLKFWKMRDQLDILAQQTSNIAVETRSSIADVLDAYKSLDGLTFSQLNDTDERRKVHNIMTSSLKMNKALGVSVDTLVKFNKDLNIFYRTGGDGFLRVGNAIMYASSKSRLMRDEFVDLINRQKEFTYEVDEQFRHKLPSQIASIGASLSNVFVDPQEMLDLMKKMIIPFNEEGMVMKNILGQWGANIELIEQSLKKADLDTALEEITKSLANIDPTTLMQLRSSMGGAIPISYELVRGIKKLNEGVNGVPLKDFNKGMRDAANRTTEFDYAYHEMTTGLVSTQRVLQDLYNAVTSLLGRPFISSIHVLNKMLLVILTPLALVFTGMNDIAQSLISITLFFAATAGLMKLYLMRLGGIAWMLGIIQKIFNLILIPLQTLKWGEDLIRIITNMGTALKEGMYRFMLKFLEAGIESSKILGKNAKVVAKVAEGATTLAQSAGRTATFMGRVGAIFGSVYGVIVEIVSKSKWAMRIITPIIALLTAFKLNFLSKGIIGFFSAIAGIKILKFMFILMLIYDIITYGPLLVKYLYEYFYPFTLIIDTLHEGMLLLKSTFMLLFSFLKVAYTFIKDNILETVIALALAFKFLASTAVIGSLLLGLKMLAGALMLGIYYLGAFSIIIGSVILAILALKYTFIVIRMFFDWLANSPIILYTILGVLIAVGIAMTPLWKTALIIVGAFTALWAILKDIGGISSTVFKGIMKFFSWIGGVLSPVIALFSGFLSILKYIYNILSGGLMTSLYYIGSLFGYNTNPQPQTVSTVQEQPTGRAKGGIFSAPTPAIIGENGREHLIPDHQLPATIAATIARKDLLPYLGNNSDKTQRELLNEIRELKRAVYDLVKLTADNSFGKNPITDFDKSIMNWG